MREYLQFNISLCKVCKRVFCDLVVKYLPIEAFLLICSAVGTFVVNIYQNPEGVLIALKLATITLSATFLIMMLGFAFVSVAISPFKLWKEDTEKAKNFAYKKDSLKIGIYTQYIGFIYNDLIDNWTKGGIEINTLIGKVAPPRSYNAWNKLEQLSTLVSLDDEVRDDLKKYLGYFSLRGNNFMTQSYRIKTKIKTKQTINKKKPEIKALADRLSKKLKDIPKLRDD